jgi:hypothetical protein
LTKTWGAAATAVQKHFKQKIASKGGHHSRNGGKIWVLQPGTAGFGDLTPGKNKHGLVRPLKTAA